MKSRNYNSLFPVRLHAERAAKGPAPVFVAGAAEEHLLGGHRHLPQDVRDASGDAQAVHTRCALRKGARAQRVVRIYIMWLSCILCAKTFLSLDETVRTFIL